MGRLEDKLTMEGRGLMRVLEAVIRVRLLVSSLEGKDFDVRDIKQRIESYLKFGRVDMMKLSAELLTEEYQNFRKAKTYLRRYKHGVEEGSA